MRYRVFKFADARKRMLVRVDTKQISRWDEAYEAAVWKTAAAAHMWAKRQQFEFGFVVVKV